MWLLVMFDLPVETKENRRDYRRFVDRLENNGYVRVQYSVYVRPSTTLENTEVHAQRVMNALPPDGEVRIMRFTDRQWGRTLIFRAAEAVDAERFPEQFAFFDDNLAPIETADEEEALAEFPVAFLAETVKPYDANGPPTNPVTPANPAMGQSRTRKRRKSARAEADAANLKLEFGEG